MKNLSYSEGWTETVAKERLHADKSLEVVSEVLVAVIHFAGLSKASEGMTQAQRVLRRSPPFIAACPPLG